MIELLDVFKIYPSGEFPVHALDGVTLTIEKNEFIAIVGQSGSGKSTLMNIVGCLDVPTKGHYILDGEDVGTLSDNKLAVLRNKHLGFIFQQYNLITKLNVVENVELPLIYAGVSQKRRRERAMAALERVGLSDRWHHTPNQLSGGQQQRVSIARALVNEPSVILADEPTGALDSKTGRDVLDFLTRLHNEGNTVVLITHDSGIAAEAKRIVKLSDGQVVSDERNTPAQKMMVGGALS